MSKSIYSKFIIGYLLFGLVGFIAVALFSQKMTYNYLVKQNADKFYDEAVLMASTYEDGGYYYSDVYDDTQNDTRLVASFLNARIWIVDPDGRIYLDSQNGSLNDRSIPGFDSAEQYFYHHKLL